MHIVMIALALIAPLGLATPVHAQTVHASDADLDPQATVKPARFAAMTFIPPYPASFEWGDSDAPRTAPVAQNNKVYPRCRASLRDN